MQEKVQGVAHRVQRERPWRSLLAGICAVLAVAGCSDDNEDQTEETASSAESPLVESQSAFSWDPGSYPSPEYDRALSGLLAGCSSYIAALDATPVPVAFVDEGKRVDDPDKGKSRVIWQSLENNLPALGYCARVANPSRAAARAAILRYGQKLADKYKGGTDADKTLDDDDPGNPINEHHVLPMLLGWDMIWPQMNGAERTTAKRFASALSGRVRAFTGRLSPTDPRLRNNWMMDVLAIHTYSAFVTRDAEDLSSARSRLNNFVIRSYTAPDGWRRSSCDNVADIGAYGSFDLQQRDAFIYHGKSLSTVTELAALRPGVLGDSARARSLVALEVMKDYVTGEKRHREFLCTTVEWDKGSSAFGTRWDPNESKVGFKFARVSFKGTRPWLERFGGDDYAAWIKVFVAGKGDRIAYAK